MSEFEDAKLEREISAALDATDKAQKAGDKEAARAHYERFAALISRRSKNQVAKMEKKRGLDKKIPAIGSGEKTGESILPQKGFTLIEAAITLFIAGIVFAGLLGVLQASIASRQSARLTEAVEITKTGAILASLNSRTLTGECQIGACVATGPCGGSTPCYTTNASYTPPESATAHPDAWGNKLVYTRSLLTVVRTTPPDTLVFTVTSKGPDAVTSPDDLAYPVTASEFFARISRMGL